MNEETLPLDLSKQKLILYYVLLALTDSAVLIAIRELVKVKKLYSLLVEGYGLDKETIKTRRYHHHPHVSSGRLNVAASSAVAKFAR